jgi:hypothetical protein
LQAPSISGGLEGSNGRIRLTFIELLQMRFVCTPSNEVVNDVQRPKSWAAGDFRLRRLPVDIFLSTA